MLFAVFLWLPGVILAAQDVRVNFTLNTTGPNSVPLTESRYYYVYRPDGLPKTTPVPMVLIMEASPNSGPAGFFHRKADQAGFILVSCSFSGNITGVPGTVWTSDDPRVVGYDDYDYISAVINQVRDSNNANDAFIAGISKGGHISLAYACVRPSMLKAAASFDEFMGLTSNIPSAPLPVMFIQGTLDTNVPYTMTKDTADVWRAVDSVSGGLPVTTFESSPLLPGNVSQSTWRDDNSGLQVAFVTVITGTHAYPTPAIETGYDCTDGLWDFFSQFLTPLTDAPRITSQPVNNTQFSGYPASFHVAATGLAPIRYQWQKNGADIPAATSPWLTVQDTDNGASYRAVVTNDAGTATSTAATLTLRAGPTGPSIDTQPQNQVVNAGQPATFSISTSAAGPVRYQWRKNGMDIVGETGAALNLPAAITADSGASFTVLVSSSAGATLSHRATLAVSPVPGAPILLANPARVRTMPNRQGAFSVAAWSLQPLSYQWQKGRFTSNMVDIPGANDATYTTPPATLADHLTLMRCVVSNQTGSITSADEMLFVTAAPVAPSSIDSLVDVVAQVGVPFTYALLASGGTTPFQFSASPLPGGLTFDPMTGILSGTPTTDGTTNITLDAANAAGHISATLVLTIQDDPPLIALDDWRAVNFGASATDPSIAGDTADPDGDGYTNLEEFAAGSNPLDPNSVPGSVTSSARPAAGSHGTTRTCSGTCDTSGKPAGRASQGLRVPRS